MKNIKYILGTLFLAMFVFTSCQDENYEFGSIKTPSSIQVSTSIVGQDDDNPYGDGSGFVDFTVTATNALSYTFYFDGIAVAAPSGTYRKRFTSVGVNTYTVVVAANGTGGAASNTSLEVQVFSSFSDAEAEAFLTGGVEGEGKKWYWQADKALHVGLGPVEDDYGNGEFSYEAWWNLIQPWDDEKFCMYENEFVFTQTATGVTFEQTNGPAFVPGAYAEAIGVAGDVCHGEDVATTMFGEKTVSFFPSGSKAALEGSYNEEPYRKTSFEISNGGFLGWYVGSSTYDIISVSDTEMHVRIIQAGNGFAWYQKFTSVKPVQGVVVDDYIHTNLVWEDDFNTDGAPDATKWTYDLGAGGWGNSESQTYTDSADNVKIEGGSLIITAKKEGSNYTSARLKSQGLYNFTYGRVEVKAKLPVTQGTWPAIWMLGSNFPTAGWPHCGEIDIMEQKGQDKSSVLGTVHWFNEAGNNNASDGSQISITNADTEFHLYTLEWTEDHIKIFLDDVMYYEFANEASLPFNDNFFMILNIAVGGTLGGIIDPDFSQDTMEIDYVRVYQ